MRNLTHISKLNFSKFSRYNSVFFTYLFLLIIFIVFYILFPLYRSSTNISNLLIQIAPLSLVALGQTVVLIGGGIDLSVGSVISLTTVIAANLMGNNATGILIGLLIAFLAALLIGFINGMICNETSLPPLIVTLSMSYIVQGIILWYRTAPGGAVPRALSKVLIYRFNILSVPIFITIIAYIIFSFIMSRSVFGLHAYALGKSEQYARMAGVNVKKIRILTYMTSSFFACFAGLLLASRIGSGAPLIGDPYTLESLTAAIIGGMSFAGGEGFIIGALGGAAIVGMISNALNISGIDPFYQYIFRGALLIIAMILNSFKKR
ncbi:MAG TPA: ABC transporter permease [Actinobacteria bacterium]|jgi:ribose/xylose/arabinose/galactoside ABC-type transport system permease subunit|nr:ABC transporter permease [Actinomycetota bacterium]